MLKPGFIIRLLIFTHFFCTVRSLDNLFSLPLDSVSLCHISVSFDSRVGSGSTESQLNGIIISSKHPLTIKKVVIPNLFHSQAADAHKSALDPLRIRGVNCILILIVSAGDDEVFKNIGYYPHHELFIRTVLFEVESFFKFWDVSKTKWYPSKWNYIIPASISFLCISDSTIWPKVHQGLLNYIYGYGMKFLAEFGNFLVLLDGETLYDFCPFVYTSRSAQMRVVYSRNESSNFLIKSKPLLCYPQYVLIDHEAYVQTFPLNYYRYLNPLRLSYPKEWRNELGPKTHSFHFPDFIANIIVLSSNKTFLWNELTYTAATSIIHNLKLRWNYPPQFYLHLTYWIPLDHFWRKNGILIDSWTNVHWVLVSSGGFQFITCYNLTTSMSYEFYLNPFTYTLWFGICMQLLLLAIITHLYVKYWLKLEFSPYLMMFSSIMEHSFHIPLTIWNRPAFKLTIGIWLLLSIIFTNSYKSLMIQGLTAPRGLKSVSKFNHLVIKESNKKMPRNITKRIDPLRPVFYSDCPYSASAKLQWETSWKYQFKIYSTNVSIYGDQNVYPLTKLTNALWYVYQRIHLGTKATNEEMDLLKLKCQAALSHIPRPKSPPDNNKRLLPPETAIEQELTKCGQRVFVENEDKIKMEYEYLGKYYFWLNFTRSVETVLREGVAWRFSPGKNVGLDLRFKCLIQSGIYHKTEEFFQLYEYRKRREWTKMFVGLRDNLTTDSRQPQPLRMDGKLWTVFLISGLGIVVCGWVYLVKWASTKGFKFRSLCRSASNKNKNAAVLSDVIQILVIQQSETDEAVPKTEE
jgi:hypothetical protein